MTQSGHLSRETKILDQQLSCQEASYYCDPMQLNLNKMFLNEEEGKEGAEGQEEHTRAGLTSASKNYPITCVRLHRNDLQLQPDLPNKKPRQTK